MKIRILSDIHLEFLDSYQTQKIVKHILSCCQENDDDVLVLAGDIGRPEYSNYTNFLKAMSNHFKKVFLIAGNHEYYGGDILTTNELISKLCSTIPNVVFLNNMVIEYNGFLWVGTTLWSLIKDPSHVINDVKYIKGLTIDSYNQMHRNDRSFLETVLERSVQHQQKVIVITHHLPSFFLISEKYANDPYNQWFASDMDSVLETFSTHIPLWIYGHTHVGSDRFIHDTRLVCNPLGYVGENRYPNFEKNICIIDNDNKNEIDNR